MGNCDLDISGFYWNVKKCYVRIDGSVDTWLASADEEHVVEGQKLKPHVSHTFYYSNNKDEAQGPFVPCFETEENDVASSDEVAQDFGIGFYGVWEAMSDNQSFVVNKGGVFRATTASI